MCRLEGVKLLGIEEEGSTSAATGRTFSSPLGPDNQQDELSCGHSFSIKDLEGHLVPRVCFQSDRRRRREVLWDIVSQ